MAKFNLVNIEEPNLLREIYPYSEVPKIEFENSFVTAKIPDDIWITDTTFRDGQQSMAPFKEEHIVELYKYMNKLGGKNGLIRQTEMFLYTERDRKVVEKCRELGYEFPEITSWIRANEEDFKIVKEMEIKETGILTSVSDYHIYLKLKSNRKETMENYLRVVKKAVENGVVPRCHLEDITRADFYGFILPFVEQLMNISKESGVDVKIRLCDTMGYGVPFAGAKLPRSVPKMINILQEELEVPSRVIEWHGHNDFHKVLVNGTSAWLHGCSGVNGTLIGIGERTGNPPIEGLVIDYLSLKGHDKTIDTTVITEIADFMQKEMGIVLSSRYPFIGKDFNVTRAGIHADGVLKNEEIYNIFDTTKLLKRALKVCVTDKSGVAGIAHWINTNIEDLKEEVSKKHPSITKIYKWIQEEYNNGRVTSISDDELLKLTRKYLPEIFKTEFEAIEEKTEKMALELVEEYSNKPEIMSMDAEKITEILEEIVANNQFLQMAYVTDTDGIQITENIAQPWIEKAKEISRKGDDRSSRPWFASIIKEGKSSLTDYYISKTTEELCVTASAPITNTNGEFVGVVAMDFNFSNLTVAAEEDTKNI